MIYDERLKPLDLLLFTVSGFFEVTFLILSLKRTYRVEYKHRDGIQDTPEEINHYEQTHYEIYMILGAAAIFLFVFKAIFFIFLVNRYPGCGLIS